MVHFRIAVHLLKLAALAYCSWLIGHSIAQAQTPTLPGFPPGTFQSRAALDAVGGVLPTISFVGNTLATVSAPNATASSISLGPAGSKLVVVAIHDAFNVVTANVTIDTVPATKIGELNFGQAYAGLFAAVTSNATGTIQATTTSGPWNGPNFSVYSIINLSSTTAVGSNTNSGTATGLSTTIATSAGGVSLGTATSVASDVTPASFGGTETYTTNVNSYVAAIGYVRSVGVANNTGVSGSSTVTVTNTGSDNIALIAASWR